MPYREFSLMDMSNATAAEVLAWNTIFDAIESISERLCIANRQLIWDRLEGTVQKLESEGNSSDQQWDQALATITETYTRRIAVKRNVRKERI